MSVFLQRLTLAVAIVGGALLVSGFEEAQAVMCLAGPTSLQKKHEPLCRRWDCQKRAKCQLSSTLYVVRAFRTVGFGNLRECLAHLV